MSESNAPSHAELPVLATPSNTGILTTLTAVADYLTATPFRSKDIQRLTGGAMNHTYRIHLVTPFKGKETVIIKYAQQAVSGGWTTNPVDVIRQKFEVEAVTRIRKWLNNSWPTSIVTVPEIYHYDADNNVIVMEDSGVDTIPLIDFTFRDKFSTPGVAKMLGETLAEFLASMHEWSRGNPDGILDLFDTALHAKLCTARWHNEDLMQTLQLAGDDVPKLLVDNSFKANESDLHIASKIANQFEKGIMSTRDTLIMGDFRPGNIMVRLGPDNFPSHLYVIDWELSSTGPPGVELGRFCCEMQIIMDVSDSAREPASIMLSSFLDAYKRYRATTHPLIDLRLLARDVLASCATLLFIFLPRSPMPPHVDTFELVKEALRWLINSRQDDFIKQSFVNSLLC